MNKSPTERFSWSAMMTSIMLGGMRIPRVPEAATVPRASDLSYPCRSMMGRERTPRSTTDAPMMPVEAARMMPITATEIARPPRTLPNIFCMASIIFSAMPERSSIRPM